MKCPRCGADSQVKETRPAPHLTTRRRRECFNGHRFVTVEVHEAAFCSAKQRAVVLAQTIARRVALWHRDRAIARDLHLGWKALARRYDLEKSAIFLAAKRGRGSR